EQATRNNRNQNLKNLIRKFVTIRYSHLPASACSATTKAAATKPSKATASSTKSAARRKASPRTAMPALRLREKKPCCPERNVINAGIISCPVYLRTYADDNDKENNENYIPGKLFSFHFFIGCVLPFHCRHQRIGSFIKPRIKISLFERREHFIFYNLF